MRRGEVLRPSEKRLPRAGAGTCRESGRGALAPGLLELRLERDLDARERARYRAVALRRRGALLELGLGHAGHLAIEAMARARSVVATDVAGVREGLEGGCGAVVPVAATDELARALISRLERPELAAREGAAGRLRVEQRHDVVRTAERVAELYGLVLSGG